MFWVWLVKEVFLFLLATPLRFLFTLACLFLWKPAFRFNPNTLKDNGDPESKYKSFVKNFNPRDYALSASSDQAKFLGMFLAVHPSEENKELLLSYITPDYYFTRKIGKRHGTWSGDMTAGWLYALTSYLRDRLVTEEDFDKVERAYRKAFFEKPYCQHHSFNGKFDRGFLFRWWFTGPDFVVLLAVLTVLKTFGKDKRWKLLYYLFRLLSFPWADLLPEASVQRGRFFWISWYAAHSKAVLAKAVLNVDPSNGLFKKVLTNVYRKHGFYNPDIVALYCSHFGWTEKDKDFVERWLRDYTEVKERKPVEQTRFIHLKYLFKRRSLKKSEVVMSKEILPTSMRHNEYLWEKDALRMSYGEKSFLDFAHLYRLWEATA